MEKKVPVLMVVFKRLDTTKRVFEAVRQYQPKSLYIASDGARRNIPDEMERVKEVQDYILDHIDWVCDVKTLFRTENVGCSRGPSEAITWMLQNEEMGIILEDDCVPDPSFFTYCNELLEKYKYDERVMSITGYNIIGSIDIEESYLFSRYMYGWGWATWRRAWDKMDIELRAFDQVKAEGKLKDYYHSLVERVIINKRVKDCKSNKVSAWDYQWIISHHMNRALSIVPSINLVENIGFSNEFSTHTKENYWDIKFLRHPSASMNASLIHPTDIREDKAYFRKYLSREVRRIIFKKFIPFK